VRLADDLLCAIFALSGAAALAFETLWFHQAGLAFGNGVWASSLVLAAFMAGLAVGNGLAARYGDRLRAPLRAFALLEAGVASSGLALVLLLPELTPLLARVLAPLSDLPWALNTTRLAVAFVLLLLPSTAMGLGLPVLARVLEASGAAFGPSLGRLYGWNTAGAVAGALLAGGLGIEVLGVRGTALAAAAGSLTAAIAAAGLVGPLAAASPAPPPPSAGPGRWRAAVFASGFALLALEVVWFRTLALCVVTRAEVFAWMLATVLAGLAGGGLAAGGALRRQPGAHRHAATLAFAAAAATVASYGALPPVAAWLGPLKSGRAGEVFALCAVLMLPVSALSGGFFTLAGAGLRARLPGAARTAGTLTLANTLGATLGALTGGFLLLPALGVERSVLALSALYALIGGGLAWSAPLPRHELAAAGAVAIGALVAFPFGSMDRHVRRALDRYEHDEHTRVTVHEGRLETLLWIENRFLGKPYYHRLLTDGYSMSATDVQARRYMKLYVVLPVAVHPALRRALLVSYGVGSTARALVDTGSLEHIDVVDLSSDILEMSRRAIPAGGTSPLDDPRVAVHVEDGRWFLHTTSQRYDLITAEPPPPMLAGVVNLYTREYFSLLRDRLAEGGMVTYWLPLRALSDRSALAILGAFCDVFDDCSLWRGMGFDLMLFGTRGARGPVSERHFEAQWRDPVVGPELRALGFERPAQLGALFIAGADDLNAARAGVPPLVDDRPRRIVAPTRDPDAVRALYTSWLDPRAGRERFARSELVARLVPPRMRREAEGYFATQHLLDSFAPDIRSDRWSERLRDLHALLSFSDLTTPVLWLLGSDADAQRIVASAPEPLRASPRAQLHRGIAQLAARDYARAARSFARAEADPETREDAVALRIFALCMADRRDEARRLATWDRLGRSERARDYWRFMRETFGVAPEAP
jgi:spermidine synthase